MRFFDYLESFQKKTK